MTEVVPTPGLRGLYDRRRRLVHELAKFVVVGGFCFVLDVALANLFHFGAGIGPTTSKAGSTIIATVVSYAGNRLWSFSHRVDATTSQTRDITVYAVINLIGLVITLVPVAVVHYALHRTGGVAFNVSSIIGTAVATVFRFWAYRRYVFAGQTDPAERAALV